MINKLITTGCLIALTTTPVFADETQEAKDPAAQQEMKWAFADVDSNHDMKITEDEIKAKGQNLAKFKKADINSDGSLDENEFVDFGCF